MSKRRVYDCVVRWMNVVVNPLDFMTVAGYTGCM